MGLGQKFLTQVGSAIYGLGLGLKNFPLKMSIFQFFALWVKNLFGLGQKLPGSRVGQPLIYCRSKVCFMKMSPLACPLQLISQCFVSIFSLSIAETFKPSQRTIRQAKSLMLIPYMLSLGV